MTFKNIWEAREWFLDYQPFDDKDIPFFTYDYNYKDWQFGDYFLFRHINMNHKVITRSRPILGLFLDFTYWDMAMVVNYVEKRRAWTYHHNYQTTGTDEKVYDWKIASADYETNQQSLWHDNIQIIGYWKRKPNIGELKSALLNSEPEVQECDATDDHQGTETGNKILDNN